MSEKPPILISPARIRKYVKEHGSYELVGIRTDLRVGQKFLDELNLDILGRVDWALRRIKGKKRQTLKPEDLK